MSDDQFTRLFNHMNKRFDELRSELHSEVGRVEGRVERLHSVVETLSGRIQDSLVENTARDAQLSRHEQAIDQLAARTGTQLQYE